MITIPTIMITNTTRMASDPLVLLEDAAVRLGRDVRVTFPRVVLSPGGRLAVTGPSGCGKSTLLNIVSGLLRADQGTVSVCDHDLRTLRASALDRVRGRNLGFVYQRFLLLPAFSAWENVCIGLRFAGLRNRREAGERARQFLERVGLSRRMHARPSQLSVGECQRVAVARAMATGPRLLLADEPTGALDPVNGASVLALMDRLCAENGCAWICVTHDPDVAARFENRLDARGWARHGAEA